MTNELEQAPGGTESAVTDGRKIVFLAILMALPNHCARSFPTMSLRKRCGENAFSTPAGSLSKSTFNSSRQFTTACCARANPNKPDLKTFRTSIGKRADGDVADDSNVRPCFIAPAFRSREHPLRHPRPGRDRRRVLRRPATAQSWEAHRRPLVLDRSREEHRLVNVNGRESGGTDFGLCLKVRPATKSPEFGLGPGLNDAPVRCP